MRLSQIQKSSRRKTASPCGIQIRERRVNWIKDSQLNTVLFQRFWGVCSHRKQFDQWLYVHVERQGKPCQDSQEYLPHRHRLFCFARPNSWRCLGKLFVVWQSWLWKSMAQVLSHTRLCGACLEGENSWLQVVATAVGAACLKRAGAGFSWACSFDEQSALHEKSDNYSWYETKPLISPILDSNAQVQIDTMLLYAVYSTYLWNTVLVNLSRFNSEFCLKDFGSTRTNFK